MPATTEDILRLLVLWYRGLLVNTDDMGTPAVRVFGIISRAERELVGFGN